MVFTDILFLLFFGTVFPVYWLVLRKHVKAQNIWILAASYLFYGWWDWRFLGLIILTSLTTFAAGLVADKKIGKAATTANIVFNLGILLVFKYLGFFGENLTRLLHAFGLNIDWFTIEVLLPVGISFYTFQAISYSVDVYKGDTRKCTDPIAFFTYIAYFPQLVAGPIERASDLIPQIERPRQWNYGGAVSGMRMILFGLVKKLCIADMAGIFVDRIYAQGLDSPAALLAGTVLFTIQVYCDFSAYSEIARGVSRLLGIELMANFRYPYFSRNILEFWSRWHISLMFWLRQYVYIPLGGNRRGKSRAYANTCAVFVLSGLWHGAGWNYILWGVCWALLYMAAKIAGARKRHDGIAGLHDIPSIVATMGIVVFTFFIFRSQNGEQLLSGLPHLWIIPAVFGALWAICKGIVLLPRRARQYLLRSVAAAAALAAVAACVHLGAEALVQMLKAWWLIPAATVLIIEWTARDEDFPLARVPHRRWLRRALYWFLFAMIVFSEPVDMSFIYFQF